MAMRNPVGRVNYQPNTYDGTPKETGPSNGVSFNERFEGHKQRLRPSSFADHYSQARMFFRSQTDTEQQHIAKALIFELSKVEALPIRERIVSHLLNIDEALAHAVAGGLGLTRMPDAAVPAVEPVRLAPSDALSIQKNPPPSLDGRKVGALVTDGIDASLLLDLRRKLATEGVTLELVAPKVGGIVAGDQTAIPADHMIGGGPSVLFDAVVVLASIEGIADILNLPPARDFVADAFAHCKIIACTAEAEPLLEKAGVVPDEGVLAVKNSKDITTFIAKFRAPRIWSREMSFQKSMESAADPQ